MPTFRVWNEWDDLILYYHNTFHVCLLTKCWRSLFSFVQRQRTQKKDFRDIAVCHVSRVQEWRNAFVTLLVARGCPQNCRYEEPDMRTPLTRSYYLELDWRGDDLGLALFQVTRQAERSIHSRLRETIHSTGHSNSLCISTENCNSWWTAVQRRTVGNSELLVTANCCSTTNHCATANWCREERTCEILLRLDDCLSLWLVCWIVQC